MAIGQPHRHAAWACYHTQLHTFAHQAIEYGIVGRTGATWTTDAPFQMAQDGEDFEKGPDQGSHTALQVISWTARPWLQWHAG
jgi:hypothetical protein